MNEELKIILIDLVNVIDYALIEIEKDCKPDLDWEKNQLRKIQDRIYNL